MSNKLFNMFMLASSYPTNKFYVLDMKNVPPEEINSYLKNGLRNFKANSKSQELCIRTAVSGKQEINLPLFKGLDAADDEIIIEKMKEALRIISRRFNGYSNAFIIIQEWIPESDYLFSINLLPQKGKFLIESTKGNHALLKRGKASVFLFSQKGIQIIKQQLRPDEAVILKRLIMKLVGKYVFVPNTVYELSFTKRGAVFYDIKTPLPTLQTKEEFYNELRKRGINFKNRILMYDSF